MKLSTGDVKGIPLMSIPRALLAFVQKSQSNQITDADLALKQNPEQMQSILPITIPAKHLTLLVLTISKSSQQSCRISIQFFSSHSVFLRH